MQIQGEIVTFNIIVYLFSRQSQRIPKSKSHFACFHDQKEHHLLVKFMYTNFKGGFEFAENIAQSLLLETNLSWDKVHQLCSDFLFVLIEFIFELFPND
jgi:hypothetical protein